MSAQESGSHRLRVGQPVTVVDHKGRVTYTQRLEAGGVSRTRGDAFEHDAIIGQPDGTPVTTEKGRTFHVFAATLADHTLNMTRYATIVYPKDVATLLVWADLYPGATVVEAGLGSGALTLALLRAVGPTGRVVTYEVEDAALNTGRRNIADFAGEVPNHELREGDIYAGFDVPGADRLVLDVPEPWQVVPHAERTLRPGAIFAGYVPTVLQMQRLVLVLRRGPWSMIECTETLLRGWQVTGRSVRPEQRMVGHTGFLVFARLNLR